MNWFNFLKQDMREQLEQETRVVDSEKLRQERQARMAQEQAEATKPQPVAQPSVPSQLPARARQVLSSGQQALGTTSQAIGDYYSSVAPTSRPQATEDVRRRGSIQQAPSNRYYQTLERFKKPERKDFQEEGKEVDEEAYQQAMEQRSQSMRDFAGQERQDYDAWFKEQMKNNPQILDQRDKRLATPNQKRLRSLGRGLSSVTGLSLPRGLKRRFGTDRVSEMEGSAKNLALFREQQGEKVAPLTDDGEVNPDFKEEQQATLDENQTTLDENQMTLDNFPSKEPELPQASKDVLREPTGTLSDFGMTFTEGSEESPAAKAAREAREKNQAKQDASSKPKTSVQPKLGRGDWRHTLPKDHPDYVPFEEINIGRFAPKASTTAASVNLGERRLDDAKGYGDNLQPDGGKGNLKQHTRRKLSELRPKPEPKGKETTLEEYQS